MEMHNTIARHHKTIRTAPQCDSSWKLAHTEEHTSVKAAGVFVCLYIPNKDSVLSMGCTKLLPAGKLEYRAKPHHSNTER